MLVEIETVDRDTGVVMDTAGNVGQVTSWYDAYGDPCPADRAVYCVCWCAGYWAQIQLNRCYRVSIH